MLDRFPKPVLIGVIVVILLLAAGVIFKTVSGGGENGDRPSRADIQRAQQQAAGQTGGRSQTNGH